jgi:hypothetical protein
MDDCFGAWNHHPDPEIDQATWLSFKVSVQCFGKLEWEFTEHAKTVDFPHLTISTKPNGTVKTKLFEKRLNLCLCIPPHSAHPPGVTAGLIFGMIKRIFRLATDTADQKSATVDIFQRLQARGHHAADILPMFLAALSNASKPLHCASWEDSRAARERGR